MGDRKMFALLVVGLLLLSLGAVPAFRGKYTHAENLGSVLWEYQAGGSFEGVSIATNGEYVVAGSGWPDDTVYVFNSSGDLKWKYKTEGFVNAVAISSDGEYIIAAVAIDTNNDGLAEIGKLYLFDTSGHVLWTYDSDYPISSVAFSQGFIIFASKGIIYEFDIKGNLRWTKTVNIYNLQLDVSDKYIVVGHSCWFYKGEQNYNTIYLFTLNGDLKWKKTFEGDVINSVAISKNGDYIAVGTGLHWDSSGYWLPGQNGYHVYVLDENGNILWGYKTNGRVSAVDIASNANYIVVGSDKLYLFDRYNHLLWNYTPESLIAGVSITPDGKYVVAGTWSGQLYLFETYAGNIEQLPIDFVYSPDNPRVGETIYFMASIPNELRSKEVEYIWDFGDGHVETSNSEGVYHTYSMEGDYKVTLTVKVKENENWNIVGRVPPKVIHVQSLSEQEQEIYEILTKIDKWFNSADEYISDSDLSGIVSDMFNVYISQEDTIKGEHEEYLPRIPSSYLEDVKGISPKYMEFSENAPAPTITSSELRKLLNYLHEIKTTPVYINGIAISKNINGEFSIKYPDKTVYIREVTSERIPDLGYVVIYKPQDMKVYVNNVQETVTILAEPKLIFNKITNRVSSRVDLWFGASCIIISGKEVCPDVKSVFKGDFDIDGGASVGIDDILGKLGDLVQGKLSILSPIFELVGKIMKLANDFEISIPTEGSTGIEGGIEFENLKMQKYYVRSWSSVQLDDMEGETSCSVGVRADNPDIGQALLTFPINLGQTLALASTNIPVVNELIYSIYVEMVTLIPSDWKDNLYVESSSSKSLVDKKYGPVSLGVDAEVGTSMRLVPVWDPRWNLNVHGGVIGKISAESPDIPLWGILNLKVYGEAELPILELEFGDPIKPNMPDIHTTFISDQPIGSKSLYKGIALSFNITTDTSCNCTIMPLLVLNNTPVVALRDNVYLQKGSNIVTLIVPGQYVYYTDHNGPFNVGLIINNENGSLIYSNFSLRTTKNYNYTDFEHVIPEFSIKYKPIDKDSDGLYDAIEFNITEKEGLTGITLRPVLMAPGWIVYLNATNLTTSSTYITELNGMYVRKLTGNFTFVFYVYNTTSGIYLGTYSKEITVNPSKFESAYPTIQSFEPVVVNNTPALKFNVSVPQKSNLTITVRYQIDNAIYESAQIYPNATSDTYIIVPLDKDVFIMHNTTTAKIISANLVSNGLTVDTVPINQNVTFSIIPDARILNVETVQINNTLLVSTYITSYKDTNATAVVLLTFGNNSVASYKYSTLRSLIPTGILAVFNFTLENLTDAIRESNGTGQLSIALYDEYGNLLAIQTMPITVSYIQNETEETEKVSSLWTYPNNIVLISRIWTYWFLKYHDEFTKLYANIGNQTSNNESLKRALELHENATNLMIEAWWGENLGNIRNGLWNGNSALPMPKFWEVRKAYILEKRAVELLKKALNGSTA